MSDDESADELTGSALLDNIPPMPVRAPSLQSRTPTDDFFRPKSSKSFRSMKTVADDLEKPLPPIPRRDSSENQRQNLSSRPALSAKSTNIKVASGGQRRPSKPKISPPLPQDTTAISGSSRPATGHSYQDMPATQTSTADAAELSRKISSLMQQAATQETQTKQKTTAYAKETGKPSPYQRGKQAFVKATRAVKDRLSNSSRKRSRNPRRPLSTPSSSEHEVEPPPHYDTEAEIRRGRLDRRIAEGENLGNPKIRSMMGDGNIPRKPLPVYESMKSRSQNQISDTIDDPFQECREPQRSLPSQDYSSLDFNFNKSEHRTGSKGESLPNINEVDSTAGPSRQHLNIPGTSPYLSKAVSGLAQHTDTAFFSSSPIGHSTPRIRLDPYSEPGEGKELHGGLVRTPSILEFSFEGQIDEATEAAPRDPDGSTSVKRKGTNEEIWSQLTPAYKRAKTQSIGSQDAMGLAAGISRLETGDERAPLSPKSTNADLAKPNRNASRRTGLRIFDVGKGKATETRGEDKAKKLGVRLGASKRSSSRRSSSVLFSRESRAGMRRLTPSDKDEMDIDELETDDIAYQVGGRRE